MARKFDGDEDAQGSQSEFGTQESGKAQRFGMKRDSSIAGDARCGLRVGAGGKERANGAKSGGRSRDCGETEHLLGKSSA
jgi:hypothetical protein